jgi:hypothetical protein
MNCWPKRVRKQSPPQIEAERRQALHLGCARAISSIALVVLSLSLLTNAQTNTAAPAKPAATATNTDDPQLYRNPAFGFRYQIPFGWVDRTKEMQSGDEAGKAAVLLALFEHPPEATADTVNSAIVIATESTASYPGLKKAEDYLGPLTELATARGLKPEGDPYLLTIETRQLVRADFSKALNDKLTLRQCTLILLNKGQILSLTFIAGSEDDLDDLVDRVHFAAPKSAAHQPANSHP